MAGGSHLVWDTLPRNKLSSEETKNPNLQEGMRTSNENQVGTSPPKASVFCWPERVPCNLDMESQMTCGGGAVLPSQGGEMRLRSASLPRTWSLSHTCSVKPGSSLQRGAVCSGPRQLCLVKCCLLRSSTFQGLLVLPFSLNHSKV